MIAVVQRMAAVHVADVLDRHHNWPLSMFGGAVQRGGAISVLEMAAVSGHKTLQMLRRHTRLQAEKLVAK